MIEDVEVERLYCAFCKEVTPHSIHGFKGEEGNLRFICSYCGKVTYDEKN